MSTWYVSYNAIYDNSYIEQDAMIIYGPRKESGVIKKLGKMLKEEAEKYGENLTGFDINEMYITIDEACL